MGKLAETAVAKLRTERDETLRALLPLQDSDCRYPARWANTDRHVNFMLRMFSAHQLDHLQQMQKVLRDRQRGLTEAQLLLLKAHALQGELEALALSLEDDEFSQPGPNEGDWSPQQIVEHVADIERMYREEISRAVVAGRGS
jgi:hypothetical protein